jgi:hypothetical protein
VRFAFSRAGRGTLAVVAGIVSLETARHKV